MRLQKSTERADRKKRDRTVELPPIVRNPENRRRRVKLPEAMREIGLDESALAEMMMQLLLKLRGASKHEAAEVASGQISAGGREGVRADAGWLEIRG